MLGHYRFTKLEMAYAFSNSLERLNFVDVDNDTESRNLELRRFARNAYIGFSIFDIIHIVCSVLVLIYIYANDAVHPIVAAECCVEIVFSLLLIAFIAALAKKAYEKGTGARGLRSIMEDIMLDVMYDVPSRQDVKECVITDETVNGAAAKLVLKKK